MKGVILMATKEITKDVEGLGAYKISVKELEAEKCWKCGGAVFESHIAYFGNQDIQFYVYICSKCRYHYYLTK